MPALEGRQTEGSNVGEGAGDVVVEVEVEGLSHVGIPVGTGCCDVGRSTKKLRDGCGECERYFFIDRTAYA